MYGICSYVFVTYTNSGKVLFIERTCNHGIMIIEYRILYLLYYEKDYFQIWTAINIVYFLCGIAFRRAKGQRKNEKHISVLY